MMPSHYTGCQGGDIFSDELGGDRFSDQRQLVDGELDIQSLVLPNFLGFENAQVTTGDKHVRCRIKATKDRVVLAFSKPLRLTPERSLLIRS
jgi:hypothetical protein